MPPTERERLDRLREEVDNDPPNADWDVLCSLLDSDEVEIRTEAEDLRSELIERGTGLSAAVDDLLSLLRNSREPRHRVIDTLARVVRADPERLVPRIAELLDGETPVEVGTACYVLAGTANGPAALVKPHAPTLVDRLGDADLRIRSLAMYALANLVRTYPEATTAAVGPATDLIEYQGIAGGEPGKPGVDPVSDREVSERLTPRIVRPRRQALEFLVHLANRRPTAVRPAIEPLTEFIERLDPSEVADLSSALRVLTRVARVDSETVEAAGITDVMARLSDEDSRRIELAVWRLGAALGQPLPTPQAITSVELADRDEHVEDGDIERAQDMEMDLHYGEPVDLDEVLRLLRSRDPEVRDAAAFSAQFLTDRGTAGLQERAADFAALIGEPHGCTRSHLLDGPPGLLSRIVRDYPLAWKPVLFELLERDDPVVRADALVLIAAGMGSLPEPYRMEFEEYASYLDASTMREREGALRCVSALAGVYPEDINPTLVSRLPALTDEEEPREAVLSTLWAIGKRRPTALDPVIEDLLDLLRAVARADTDAGASAVDPMGRRIQITEGDQTQRLVLSALFEVAKQDPEAVTAIKPELTELVDARADGWETAYNVLDAIRNRGRSA